LGAQLRRGLFEDSGGVMQAKRATPAAAGHGPRKFVQLDSKNGSEVNPPASANQGGARHRRKGDRVEREIIALHKALGIAGERYPASGATRFRGSGHDIDLYLFGDDAAPAVCEVKARKDGAGFMQLEKWLGEYDALFLRRNNAEPLVLVPWRVWKRLLEQVPR
jgi:Holliday junction resolvase